MRQLEPRERNWLRRHGWSGARIEQLAASDDQTPVEYLTGTAEFGELQLRVTPSILIPRLETEELVDWTGEWLAGTAVSLVVDVGTGSGAIAIALARRLERLHFLALDCSEAALEVARDNINRYHLGARIETRVSDLLTALLPGEPTDEWTIIANLPYIPTPTYQHLAASVKDFEPRLALDGGPDGLALIRRLLVMATARPRRPVAIFLETDPSHDLAALPEGSAYAWTPRRDSFGQRRLWRGLERSEAWRG